MYPGYIPVWAVTFSLSLYFLLVYQQEHKNYKNIINLGIKNLCNINWNTAMRGILMIGDL